MIGYRSIGDSELMFLIKSENPVFGWTKWRDVRGSGCPISDYGTVCFFIEPYRWLDRRHSVDLIVELDDNTPTGIATYWASANLQKTKIFTGREGKTEVKIKEAYPRAYWPEDIRELHLHNRFTDSFAERIKRFCEKYNVAFYR